jgi:hypothetical protein
MKLPFQSLYTIFSLLAILILCVGHFPSLTEAYTGAPGETTCRSCHSTPLNTMEGGAYLEGLPDYVVGGQAYVLNLVMYTENSIAKTAGFQLTFLEGSGISNGTLEASGENVDVLSVGIRQYAQHGPAIEFNTGDVGNEYAFEFIWTPEDVTSPKNINGYAATLLGNGNQLVSGGQRQDSTLLVQFNTTIAPELLGAILELNTPECNGDATGSLQVISSGGIGPLEFEWSNGETSSGISGLMAGTYSVTITDQSNQELVLTNTITEPTEITTAAVVTHPSCHDSANGSIELSVDGGTTPYTYAIDGNTFTNLDEGTYGITVTDDNGCTHFTSYNIAAPEPITISIIDIQHQTPTEEGFVFVNVEGGTTPYTFFWEAANSTFTNVGQHLDGIEADTYHLTVTDANECEAFFTAEILFITASQSPESANYPIQISPSPGAKIQHIEFPPAAHSGWSVSVYAAGGQLVSRKKVDTADPALQWNESAEWQDGVYYFVFSRKAPAGQKVVRWIKQSQD